MRLLLDTHALIWALTDTRRLPGSIQRLIGSARNEIFVSAVSFLEVAVKRTDVRRGMPKIPADKMLELSRDAGYVVLDVRAEHCAAVESIPSIHGDPFDRLLVAQALEEGLRLVTHDQTLAAYSDTIITF